jgi:hypothetical protein
MPSSEDCAVLKAFYESADNVRIEVERRWGCGRLEALADPILLARFRRQQATWRESLASAWALAPVPADALALVEQKTASMIRAWRVLEDAAAEAGHREIAPWVWEVRLADGGVAALVQTEAEVGKVAADGRFLKVYTMAEIGALLDAVPTIFSQPADVIPGRALAAAPRLGFFPISGDEIPFDDPIPFGAEGVSA